MPILNVQVDTVGQSGQVPNFIYISTNDTVAEVTTAGYLNGLVAQNIPLSEYNMALVSTKTSPSAASTEVYLFDVTHSGGNWSLVANTGSLVLPNGQIFVGNAGNIATAVAMSGDIGITNTGVTSIQAGVIVNADVNAAAAIAFSKLAALPSAQILVGSAGNVATATAVTGDVTITNGGVTAIAADSIVNADINSAAAIDFSKLAALTSANILVGSAGNVATSVAMSGDVTISNAGVTTIGAGAIDLAMLSAGITPAAIIVFFGQLTTVGGSATEAFTVTGAVGATDRAFVQIVDDGTANVTVLQAVVTDNTLTITFSANPGNDAVFNYQIIRAAA